MLELESECVDVPQLCVSTYLYSCSPPICGTIQLWNYSCSANPKWKMPHLNGASRWSRQIKGVLLTRVRPHATPVVGPYFSSRILWIFWVRYKPQPWWPVRTRSVWMILEINKSSCACEIIQKVWIERSKNKNNNNNKTNDNNNNKNKTINETILWKL